MGEIDEVIVAHGGWPRAFVSFDAAIYKSSDYDLPFAAERPAEYGEDREIEELDRIFEDLATRKTWNAEEKRKILTAEEQKAYVEKLNAEERADWERSIRQRYERSNPGKTPDPAWIKAQVDTYWNW